MASIRQLKNKRWVAIVYLGRDPVTGKKKQKWIYGDSQREVTKKANELEYKLNNNLYTNPTKITVGEYLDEWFSVYKKTLAETTQSLYQMYINVHIKPALGKIRLQKLLPLQVQSFYNDKLQTQKGTTVYKYHVLLNRAMEDAVVNKIILDNPCKYTTIPNRKSKYKPTVYDPENLNKLLDIVYDTVDEKPIILAAGAGLRRGEVFGVRWENVDFENKTITIENTIVRFDKYVEKDPKSETSLRTFTVPQIVLDVLKRHMKKEGRISGFICHEFKPDSYSQRFRKLLKKHGLPHIRFHDLRHYHATLMLRSGVPDKVASKRLGHSSVTVTREIYQHVLEDMDQEAASKIDLQLQREQSKN